MFKQNDVPSSERQIAVEEVLTWCQEFHVVSYIETSAKTAENVSAAFIMAVREWRKCDRKLDLTDGGNTIDLSRTVNLNGKGKSSCCGGSNRNNNSQPRQTQHEMLQ